MLRRFEIYSLRKGIADPAVQRLEVAFRRSEEFIPAISHSVVGRNVTEHPIDLIWEHAFASPEAYRTYMVHPYHACVLDRYLLRDSPERIVTDGVLGDGALIGYTCEAPTYRLDHGVRRLYLLGLDGPEDEQARCVQALRSARASRREILLSVVERNTMGSAWFDGVTPILPPSRWTHIWELGFESMEAYEAFRMSDTEAARSERAGWQDEFGRPIRRSVELLYRVSR